MNRLHHLNLVLGLCLSSLWQLGFAKTNVCNAQENTTSLAAPFSDHMVLQRERPVPVWGTATAAAQVTVEFAGQTKTTTADAEGEWMVELAPLVASDKPQDLIVRTSSPNSVIKIQDVLVGEVWIASGQSNMEWEMQWKTDSSADIPQATHASIRLLQVPLVATTLPQSTIGAQWTTCTPENVASFSAVGYYFGLRLHEELKVPVGVVQSAWGGTMIEPWTSLEGLESVPELSSFAANVRQQIPTTKEYKTINEEYLKVVDQWRAAAATALQKGEAIPGIPAQPPTLAPAAGSPTALFNAMIHPLAPMSFRGAIWYQGESNHSEGDSYVHKTRALIESWRRAFKNAEMPFYYVQIAPYNYGEDPEILARFWKTQENCMKIPGAGMAVINDLGEVGDIHPSSKKEVARRLSLWALSKTYGNSAIDPNGPIYSSYKVEGSSIRVHFDHAKALKSRDGKAVSHLEIAGDDGAFVPAQGTIDGNTLLVSSPAVTSPKQVRFAWHMLAIPNLADEDNLSATAFHSHWPIDPELGQNFALNRKWVSSDVNGWGWDAGLTDGSWGTRNPQCFATGVGEVFPKTVTIDLEKACTINLVRMGVPDIGSTRNVVVSTSKDGTDFEVVGKHQFGLGKPEQVKLRFKPIEARYVRLTFVDYHDKESGGFQKFFGFITEVEAYKTE